MNFGNLTLGDEARSADVDLLAGAQFARTRCPRPRGGNPILFALLRAQLRPGRNLLLARRRGRAPADATPRLRAPGQVRGDSRGRARLRRPLPRPGEEARACYPYDYEFTVAYRFEPFGLACEFTLKNLGKDPLPWSAGHHFYFAVPWSEGAKREDYLIRIPATKHLRQDPAGQLVPGPALGPEESLGNKGLIDTFHLGLRSNELVFGEKGRPGDVTVRIGTARTPPPEATFVTWTLADDSPFFCVEPWMGPPNAPETKLGLHLVPPGQTQSFIVSVGVK